MEETLRILIFTEASVINPALVIKTVETQLSTHDIATHSHLDSVAAKTTFASFNDVAAYFDAHMSL